MSDNKKNKNRVNMKKTSDEIQIVDKIKVLCLHGYRQNSDGFKSKLGSFRKFVNKYVEFEFITAPHKAPALINDAGEECDNSDQFSWWFNKDDNTFKGTNKNGPAYGFDESLKLVEQIWNEKGPFQGLLGFSQGACFVGLICSLSTKGFTKIKPDFAIMSSGFCSGSLAHKNYYDKIIEIPALHIYGKTDQIIPYEMSELLMKTFQNVTTLPHEGGHYFPASAQLKQFYINYFQDRLQEHLEKLELQNAGDSNTQIIEQF